jgi:hypothetical protein
VDEREREKSNSFESYHGWTKREEEQRREKM